MRNQREVSKEEEGGRRKEKGGGKDRIEQV
jgi:hypothetical protein